MALLELLGATAWAWVVAAHILQGIVSILSRPRLELHPISAVDTEPCAWMCQVALEPTRAKRSPIRMPVVNRTRDAGAQAFGWAIGWAKWKNHNRCPRAIVDKNARIGSNVTICNNAAVLDGADIPDCMAVR